MKKLLLIPLILTACSTETTKETQVEPEPQLVAATACLQVGPANEDLLISNLIESGFDVDYNGSTNNWIINGVVVGNAENEDEGFALCAERSLYDEIVKFIP